MFEAEMKEKLEKIFGFKKTTYDNPDEEALEQECLFIRVDLARNNVKDTSIKSRVEGRLLVYGNSEKIPLTYFEQRIAAAPVDLTKDFFFSEITGNSGNYQNLAERSASFVYFYSGQYDPSKGTINEVTIACEE